MSLGVREGQRARIGAVPAAAVDLALLAELLGWIEGDGLVQRRAIGIVVALIGGRLVPSFTRNRLAKRNEPALPASFGHLDRVTLAGTIAGLLSWAVLPAGNIRGAAAAIAAALNIIRLGRWRGHRTGAEPLLWVLHLGYAWIPVGLALIAASAWDWVPGLAAVHALTVGAVGTMTLAVMSRATLGHSGRDLTATPGLVDAYGLVTVAASCRIGATLWPMAYSHLPWVAAIAWVTAFGCFLAVCGPILIGWPRTADLK